MQGKGLVPWRAILATASAATALLKVGELEDRIASLEAAVAGRADTPPTDPLGLP